MIQEDYVSFELAKLLKEKGFKEMCDSLYGIAAKHNGKDIDEDEEYELEAAGKADEIEYIEGGMIYNLWNTNNNGSKHEYSRPTLQMAMKWLRETHKIVIEISAIYGSNEDYSYTYVIRNKEHCLFRKFFETYEDACETAIKYCLENLV